MLDLLDFCIVENIRCIVKITSKTSKFYGMTYKVIRQNYWKECTVFNTQLQRHLSYSPWNLEVQNQDEILNTVIKSTNPIQDFFRRDLERNDLIFGNSRLCKIRMTGKHSLIVKHIIDSDNSEYHGDDVETLTRYQVSQYVRIDDPTLIFRLPIGKGGC